MVCFFLVISSFPLYLLFSLSLQQEDAAIWARGVVVRRYFLVLFWHSEKRNLSAGGELAEQSL
jgi:hypothetical protein